MLDMNFHSEVMISWTEKNLVYHRMFYALRRILLREANQIMIVIHDLQNLRSFIF